MTGNEEFYDTDGKNWILCQPKIFDEVFAGLENILAKMLSDIMEVDYDELKDNVILKRKSKDYLKLKPGEKKFAVSLDDNCLMNLEIYNKNKQIMLLYLNSSDKCKEVSFLLKPLIKIYFKNDLDKNNWENNLLIGSLNTAWCRSIYESEDNKDVPRFIRWGALFYCNDISTVSKIIKEIMSSEEQSLFINRLEKFL